MDISIVIAVILVISFLLALRSMKDLKFSDEIEKILHKKKIQGAIVFFKDKIQHFN